MNNCYYNCSPKCNERDRHKRSRRGIRPMLFLVAALLLLGVVLGAVAHAPLAFTVVAAGVIAVWLAVFAARERHARRN
ncbi:DUF3099 domain-containing protein [Streptomyces chartreusis]|uniref:DUF3099 domain-containing protein n=1 Tax=Streptomyces chartreusis TaxID=1969 RepID=UPI00123D9C62|nr:DUF3099 domain-containing protein [Streptomyces chartreusis]MCZ4610400.1 DUF3099 domain-containing protein [Streptomyces sp. Lzd4kr]QEV67551.1 DUF3099 domain-containing protein [Streptomyces chartreusis]